MPRKRRFYIPGVPAHIVQRGNNRQWVFVDTKDFESYLFWLHEAVATHGCRLHAYVLMTNHVHLLLTPDSSNSVSQAIQHLGRKYVTYFNRRYNRSGTLWEGRHKGSIIQSDSYALNCYRYIELNPVRAGMVDSPGDYRWSSYHRNALGKQASLIPLPEYQSLGLSDRQRRRAYRDFVKAPFSPAQNERINRCAQTGAVLGDKGFKMEIARRLGTNVGYDKPGRPRKRSN